MQGHLFDLEQNPEQNRFDFTCKFFAEVYLFKAH